MNDWKWLDALILAAMALMLWFLLSGGAQAETRITMSGEAYHGRGYYGPSVRFGTESGYGLRLGALKAPDKAPADKWRSLGFVELDGELCGDYWCGGAGIAYLTETTQLNGTRLNFGLHIRYKLDSHWSVAVDHYSHGRALGIAKDKSNRGVNLVGIAYSF